MAKQMVTLYVIKHASGFMEGEIEISSYELHNMSHYDAVLIGTQEVEVEYVDVDIRAAQISKLEEAVQKERAESQSRVNLLLERISKLQCISFDADGVKL